MKKIVAWTFAVAVIGTLVVVAAIPGCADDDDSGPDLFENTAVLCTNGIDDNFNGWTDCLDYDCLSLLICINADAGDAEDGGVVTDAEDGEGEDVGVDGCTAPCSVPDDKECLLLSHQIRKCNGETMCWEYFDCFEVCAEAGWFYNGECEPMCDPLTPQDDTCCCVASKAAVRSAFY